MLRSLEAKFVPAGDCQSKGSREDRALSSSQKTERREEWGWGWKQDVDLAHRDDADVSQPAEVRAWPDRFWREGLT